MLVVLVLVLVLVVLIVLVVFTYYFFSLHPQSLREALQGHDIPENVILILKEHQISFNDLKQGWILEGDFQEMEIAIGPKRRLLALHSTPDPAPGLLFLLFLLLFVIV